MSELNLQAAICKLMLEALNKHRSKIAAARSLEVTEYMLNSKIKKYGIIKNKHKYETKSNTTT